MRRVEFQAACWVALVVLSTAGCGWGPTAEVRSQYRTVRPGVAFEMLRDNPGLVVLDVRSFSDYCAPGGHLVRAVSVPAVDLDALLPSLDLSSEDTVLIYGDGSPLQTEVPAALTERGWRFVVQIDGGLDAWVAGGFAVQVEDAPISPLRPRGVQ